MAAMETLFYNLGQAMGMAILHSLWQGVLLYLVLRALLAALPGLSAGGRYNLSVVAMLGITVWFINALVTQLYRQDWNVEATLLPQVAHATSFTTVKAAAISIYQEFSINLKPQLPYISLLYTLGLLLQITRLVYNKQQLSALKKTLLPSAELNLQVQQLAQRLGIHKNILAGFSHIATVPCVAGYFKPILFLPATVYSGLSAQEVEAIIIHELAHIKRQDYLVNYAQQLLTTILFFNPFVHLVNRIINTERENSCDDIVVTVTGQPLNYAYALLKLQEAQLQTTTLALAATGKNYTLLNRIERIMKTSKTTGNIRHLTLSLVLLVGSVCSIAWLNPQFKNGRLVIKNITVPKAFHSFITDTLPKPPKAPKAPRAKAPKPPKVKAPKQGKADVAASYYENDLKLQRLSAEAERYSAALDKYYNSPQFTALEKKLDRTSEELDALYNAPAIKELQNQLDEQSKAFDLLNDSPEIAKVSAELDAMGAKTDAYYNSKEYKAAVKQYEMAAKNLSHFDQNSSQYKQTKAAFAKAAQEFNKVSHSQAINNLVQQSKDLSAKLHDYYKSDAYTAQRNKMRSLSDSLRAAYKNPEIEARQKELRSLQQQLKSFNDNAELKLNRAKLQQANQNLRAYMKLKNAEYRKRYVASATGNYNNGEKPEKIEKPEKLEKPEKPEKPEMPEKPENN